MPSGRTAQQRAPPKGPLAAGRLTEEGSTLTVDNARPAEPTAMSRCCAHHADWPTLVQHLLDEFPDATIGDVVRHVRDAREAVTDVGLESDVLDMAELIARHQLMLRTGRSGDSRSGRSSDRGSPAVTDDGQRLARGHGDAGLPGELGDPGLLVRRVAEHPRLWRLADGAEPGE
jgi:hypothetical protein